MAASPPARVFAPSAAPAGVAAGAHPHTHSHSRHQGDFDEEDPADWGLASDDEEGMDFRKKINDITNRAHSHASLAGSPEDREHLSVLAALDSFDDMDDAAAFEAELATGDTPTAAEETAWQGDELRQRSRQFSTVVWADWKEDDDDGDAPSTTSKGSSGSISAPGSTKHAHSSSVSSFTSLASDTNDLPPPMEVRHSRLSSAAQIAQQFESGAAGNASAPPSPAIAASSFAQRVYTPGTGRNNSLDSSARALGVNIVYIERLALPMLRSEVHQFFKKLLARTETLLALLETQPTSVMQRMLRGMEANAAATTDDELRRSFEQSAARMQAQINEVRNADPARSATASPPPSASPLSSVPSPFASPTVVSSPPPPSVAQSTGSLQPSAGKFSMAPIPMQSPTRPIGCGFSAHNLPARSAAPSPLKASHVFVAPLWWPAGLLASHASLIRTRDLFAAMMTGFDDAASTTSFSHGHHTAPAGALAAALASPTRLTASSGGSPPMHPPFTPMRGGKSQKAAPFPKLQALPTTHSNRDGLRLMAKLMQAFSLLVASEGGQIMQASKLALAYQRMANTLLEKHRLEEPQWGHQRQ